MTDNDRYMLKLMEHTKECEEKRAVELAGITNLVNENGVQVRLICQRLETGNKKFAEQDQRLEKAEKKIGRLQVLAERILGALALVTGGTALALLIYKWFFKQ